MLYVAAVGLRYSFEFQGEYGSVGVWKNKRLKY